MRIELYNKWINEIWELIQEKELLIEYIKVLRMRLHERYNICWIINHDDKSKSHIEEICEIKKLFDWDSENVLFIDNSCCFKCELSGDMCEDYVNGSYSSFNFIKAFVLIEILII